MIISYAFKVSSLSRVVHQPRKEKSERDRRYVGKEMTVDKFYSYKYCSEEVEENTDMQYVIREFPSKQHRLIINSTIKEAKLVKHKKKNNNNERCTSSTR